MDGVPDYRIHHHTVYIALLHTTLAGIALIINPFNDNYDSTYWGGGNKGVPDYRTHHTVYTAFFFFF